MQKNVKGYLGLTFGLLSVLFIILAFIPTNPLKGIAINLHGSINVIFGWVACGLAILAIVFGALSKRDADKKGPRKAGVIIGIFAVVISLLSVMVVSLSATLADYINEVPGNSISQSLSKSQLKELNESIEKLREAAPIDNN